MVSIGEIRQLPGNGLELIEILLEDLVQPLMIDFEIEMDEDISQARPTGHQRRVSSVRPETESPRCGETRPGRPGSGL